MSVYGAPAGGAQVRPATAADLPALYALRHAVFVDEQCVPVEEERDAADDTADHVVAVLDGAVVATGRLVTQDGVGVVGRMAVLPEARRRGVGAAVLGLLERRARERRLPAVELHAQVHAADFYRRAGYLPVGEPYDEVGIAHQTMRKAL